MFCITKAQIEFDTLSMSSTSSNDFTKILTLKRLTSFIALSTMAER